jgi:uncharacterized membrane protein YqgA involved in biofilm formation
MVGVVLLLLALVVGFVIGFKLGIDYGFKRISADPAVRFAIEMGRRMKGD